MLERDIPVVPKLNFSIVDVRDVAAAHVKAMTMEEAVGEKNDYYKIIFIEIILFSIYALFTFLVNFKDL